MKVADFNAVSVASEINLNEIAAHFGINKKFKWEDALYLNDTHLKGILKNTKNKKVYIYHFGSMVFMNFVFHEIRDVLNYLKKLDKSISVRLDTDQTEDYRIEVSSGGEYHIDNEMILIPEEKEFYFDIASMVLAKSVALDKIEVDIDAVFDKIEEIIEKLNKGKLNVSDRQLASMSARALTFKYSTISYIMLLDKPDIVWDNEDAEKVFTDLSQLFELDERYEKVRLKSETLMDITGMFASLVHARRDTRLEVMIIALIAIEIVMALIFELINRV